MQSSRTEIFTLLAGKARPLGETGRLSGIYKTPVDFLDLRRDGVEGDEQANTRSHGGPEKAVHHYPFDHYAAWREQDPGLAAALAVAGAFGENISTLGLTEDTVCVGDRFRAGTALLQVSQGRQPCWRLNVRFDRPDMARRVQDSGRSGWYYRVLEPGRLRVGDSLWLVDRPNPGWPLSRIAEVFYRDRLNRAALEQLACLPELSASWRKHMARRLETGAVEDWNRRLSTPPPEI